MLKDNRVEMMVVTILLYSTGLLQKADGGADVSTGVERVGLVALLYSIHD